MIGETKTEDETEERGRTQKRGYCCIDRRREQVDAGRDDHGHQQQIQRKRFGRVGLSPYFGCEKRQ